MNSESNKLINPLLFVIKQGDTYTNTKRIQSSRVYKYIYIGVILTFIIIKITKNSMETNLLELICMHR